MGWDGIGLLFFSCLKVHFGVGDCGTDSHVRFFSLFKLFTISSTVSTAMSLLSLSCSIVSTLYFSCYSLSLANFPTMRFWLHPSVSPFLLVRFFCHFHSPVHISYSTFTLYVYS
ncbi:hypothetical protein BJ165DRAFT_1516595 [Panaeolus papilionaceus]|nr:hypothetical protein BJ165DRAFT_1516559 [Panaeolus papilionaceus]KAF9032751.1 hypothetical protein BJ165DRAFT_1516595 [Panaeolus papilionaceus]